MSVLIKGVKMPMNCHECDALGYSDIVGIDCSEYKFDCRASCCPLVEVPTPHGRLIDADRLIKQAGQYWDEHGVGFYGVGTGNILRAPIVIEGEA